VASKGLELKRFRETLEHTIHADDIQAALEEQRQRERAELQQHVGGLTHLRKEVSNSLFSPPQGDSLVHAFSAKNLSEEEIELREMAKEVGVSVPDAEAVKQIFRSYDKDQSGDLNKEEFQNMVVHFLKIRDKFDVPSKRLDDYWHSIDSDRSGAVEFKEFLSWYYANIAPLTQSSSSRHAAATQGKPRAGKGTASVISDRSRNFEWNAERLLEFYYDPTMPDKVWAQCRSPAAVAPQKLGV